MSGLLKPIVLPQCPPQTIDCTKVTAPTSLASVKSVSGSGNLAGLSTLIDGAVTTLRIVIISDGATVLDIANITQSGTSQAVNIPLNVRFVSTLDIQAVRTGGTGAYIIPTIYLD